MQSSSPSARIAEYRVTCLNCHRRWQARALSVVMGLFWRGAAALGAVLGLAVLTAK